MKKLFFLSTFSFCLCTLSFSQEYGWTDISANMPELGGFNDVHFIGEEGWITGGNDKVYYTPDGGETFIIQNLPPLAGNDGISSSVYMKNPEEGYVVTYSGEINKTDDGGANWYQLFDPGGLFYQSVHCPPNSDTCYSCGGNGLVWKFTSNYIEDISPPDVSSSLSSIIFPENNNEGKLCGETLIRRYMNNSWINLQLYDNGFFFNSIFFANNESGWAVGSQGVILQTTDGISWIGISIGTYQNLTDVFFLNSQEGWIVGQGTLLHTLDGGTNWTPEATDLTTGKDLRAIYFTSSDKGYVVGNNTLLKYTEVSGMGDKAEKVKFEIYPNPAEAKIQIECAEFKTENGEINIFSLGGKLIRQSVINKGTENFEIDLSNLKTGMYLCTVSLENKSTTKKIIKE